jgi:SAM-dependent methyltransferase
VPDQRLEPAGSGPGELTADGCAVEVYLHLPPDGEAEIVHAALAPGASVLDLGCGTGRIAHPLLALGHPVVGVDQSAAMLAHLRGVEPVCAPIAGLDLGRRFGGVLLASHLVEIPETEVRQPILDTARRHLATDGRVVAQLYPPGWFDGALDGAGGYLGEVRIDLTELRRTGNALAGTVRYRIGEQVWTQQFATRRFDEQRLHAELGAAGLAFDAWLTPERDWFTARTAG